MSRKLVVLVVAAVVGGCSSADEPRRAAALFSPTECGTYSGRGCAPPSQRVDLRMPSFSNPAAIDNPLNPIAKLRSVVFLGEVEGESFRSETTLLPGTRTIAWAGRKVRTLASQYMAWRGGEIEEAATDWYAQADDGSVWYLGEDVFDYANGTVATTEGTWRAGREGPAAMITPADPRVADVYRPENVIGIVFEEVQVKAVGRTVAGPRGPVKGAYIASELHLDGTREDKYFAPGYGEFRTGGRGSLEALAVAAPTDAIDGPAPAELERLSVGAQGMLGSAQAEDWEAVAATLRRMRSAWNGVRADHPPPLLADETEAALDRLARAAAARQPVRTGLAATDVAEASLDLMLRHRPPVEIDRARFELWADRVLLHAAARDTGAVNGDVAAMEWVRDRFAHTLGRAEGRELDARLRDLRAATDARNLPAAADHAARLAARLRARPAGARVRVVRSAPR